MDGAPPAMVDPDQSTGINLDAEMARVRMLEDAGQEVEVAGRFGAVSRWINKNMGLAGRERIETGDLLKKSREKDVDPDLLEQTKKTQEAVDALGMQTPAVKPDVTDAPYGPQPQEPPVPFGPPTSREAAEQALKAADEAPTAVGDPLGPKSGINLARIHEGRDPAATVTAMDTADKIGNLLEASAAPGQHPPTTQKWASIDADLDTPEKSFAVLQEALGMEKGNWSAVQLHSGAKFLASLGDQLVDLHKGIKEAGPDASDAQWLKVQQVLGAFQALTLTLKGQRTEAGRALAINRKIANTIGSKGDFDAAKVMELMTELGGKENMVRQMDALENLLSSNNGVLTIAQTATLVKQSKWKTGIKGMGYIWKSILLSHPGTHLVNVTSNIMTNFYETVATRGMAGLISVPTRAVEAGLRKGAKLIGREGPAVREAGDQAYLGEVGTEAMAAASGLGDAFKAAGAAWRGGGEFGMMSKGDIGAKINPLGEPQLTGGGMRGTAAWLFNKPYQSLQSGDEFFKFMTYRKSMFSQAYREARGAGLKGDELKQRMDDILRDPTEKMHREAEGRAKYETYTEEPGKSFLGRTSKYFQTLKRDNPFVEFMVPFINTPMNILEFSIDNSPLTVLTGKWQKNFMAGGAKRDLALARLANGSVLSGGVYYMHNAGSITGGGPKNWEQRAALERTGWRPYSIRVGDAYIPYNRLGSQFGVVLAGMADIMDGFAYAKSQGVAEGFNPALMAINMMIATGRFAEEMPMLQGLGAIMDAIERGDVKGSHLGRFMASFAPNLLRLGPTIKAAVEGEEQIQRASRTDDFFASWSQNVKRKIPWLEDDVPPARYWDGSVKIMEGGLWVNGTGMIRMSKAKDDAASQALIAQGINMSEPDSALVVSGIRIDLLKMDAQEGHVYDAWIKHLGQERRKAVEATINGKEYKRLEERDHGPGGTADLMLRQAMGSTKTRKAAMVAFLDDMYKMSKDPDSGMTDGARKLARLFKTGKGTFGPDFEKARERRNFKELRETPEGQMLDTVRGQATAGPLPVPRPPKVN